MEVDESIVPYMQLDNAALSALEIFGSTAETDSKSEYSLYNLLNKCKTVGGNDLLREWLKKPLCDLEKINKRLDIVETFNESSECRDSLHRDYLQKVKDVVPLSKKLGSSKATLDDCYKLYRCICTLAYMIQTLEELAEYPSVSELVLEPLKHSSNELNKLKELIESTVMFDELTDRARIKPEIDENLLELNAQIDKLKKKADAALSDVCAEAGTDNIKLESNTETGFFFRVTLKSEKSIRALKVKTVSTKKGSGVTFTTEQLDDLNTDLIDLTSEYDTAQADVEKDVIETCGGYAKACETLAQRLAFVDVMVSFSTLCCSSANLFVRPKLFEQGTNVFDLRECRHPIVESLPFAPSFIPNDVSFEDERRFIVLTGPNMGGKSTYLKSCAVTVILGQIGCFVPCSSASFSLVDGLYCRVGAGDIQFKGVSTFMQEMQDVATILKNATKNSLVIIDELGRGTSTFDGFGLAFAVAEEIVCKIKCLTLFATHFHEFAQLKISYPTMVKNLKVDTYLDESGEMIILYKISDGIAEQSFGISIAKMVGFSEDIIKDAEENLKQLENSSVSKEMMASKMLS